jgi:hypothetical protein
MKGELTQIELKRQLHYDPKTGEFTWLISNGPRVKVGDIAGCLNNYGYICIGINGKSYKAQRLAYLYMEGYFPEYEIDHKFGIRDDNRWSKIQHVTPTCNRQNQKVNKNNKSGFTGVSWSGQRKKWVGKIRINYKIIYLGFYDNPLEAALARFTFEVQCPLWKCNYRSELVKAIKRAWPGFRFITTL